MHANRLNLKRLLLMLIFLLAAGLCMPVLAHNHGGGPHGPGDGPHGPPDGSPADGNGPPEGTPPGRGNGPHWGDPDDDDDWRPGDRGPRFGNPRGEPGDQRDDIPGFCRPGGHRPGGPGGQAGMSSIAMLDFMPPEEDTDSDARGKLVYRWMAPLFDFVLNASGLNPDTDYSLVASYEDQGDGVKKCLGTARSTQGGTLHLQNAWDIGTDLPPENNEDEPAYAYLALIEIENDDSGDSECPTAGNEVLEGVEGMFYLRYLDGDEDDEHGDD